MFLNISKLPEKKSVFIFLNFRTQTLEKGKGTPWRLSMPCPPSFPFHILKTPQGDKTGTV